MTRRKIRVLDLFAGAGGLSAGFHAASKRYSVVRAVEMDVAAAASYGENFGSNVVFSGSIQTWLAEEKLPKDIDIVVGGPPCQGFSTLGKQDAEDDRNALWELYAEAIVRTSPKYFVLENVTAFAKSRQFAELVASTSPGGALEDYTFQSKILNAADYGAFQARKRVVVVGHRRDLEFPGFPTETHRGNHRTVSEAFDNVPWAPDSEFPLNNRQVQFEGKSLAGPFTSRELHVGRDYQKLSLDRFNAIPPGGNRFDLPESLLAECWKTHRSGSADVMGRLHWDRPSVTIRTEFFKPEKGRYLHPEAMRAITHYEAALLQGFPSTFKFVGSRTSIARQIGNAVPIPLGTAIANQFVRVL